jgi:chromosome segregation ATPase
MVLDLQKQIGELGSMQAKYISELSEAAAREAALRRELEEALHALRKMREEAPAVERQMDESHKRDKAEGGGGAAQRLAAMEKEFAKTKKHLTEELEKERRALKETREKAKQQSDAATLVKNNLTKASDDLARSVEALEAELRKAKEELARQLQQLKQLQAALAEADEVKRQLKTECKSLKDQLAIAAKVTVTGNSSVDQLHNELDTLKRMLDEAQQEAAAAKRELSDLKVGLCLRSIADSKVSANQGKGAFVCWHDCRCVMCRWDMPTSSRRSRNLAISLMHAPQQRQGWHRCS